MLSPNPPTVLQSHKPAQWAPLLTQGRMTRMPERLQIVIEWMQHLPGPLQAFVAAVIVAPLRIVYDGSEDRWQRIALESILCGTIAYGIASGADYFSVPHGVAVFIGSAVGFAGVVKFREIALVWIGKRVGK